MILELILWVKVCVKVYSVTAGGTLLEAARGNNGSYNGILQRNV